MNRDFFIRLAFAAHRVADALGSSRVILQRRELQKEQVSREIKEAANSILVTLLLLGEKEIWRAAKKQDLRLELKRQITMMLGCLERAKRKSWIHSGNFSVLEHEYERIQELFVVREEEREAESMVQPSKFISVETKREERRVVMSMGSHPKEGEWLSQRQEKIVEFLKAKQQAQVWELQKILPQVTKRTLRRDLEELLEKNLVVRKGLWNTVSYELRKDVRVE